MIKLRLHFSGVGGQGTQTASRILGEAALREGIPVQVAALHGMAQRGGSVSNQVLMGGVRSPVIEPGEADALLGFEPVEAARSAALIRPGSVVIVSRSRVVPFSLTASGGSYPGEDALLSPLSDRAGAFHLLDAAELAASAGNVRAIGPVMLGALSSTGILPFSSRILRSVLEDLSPAGRLEISLTAYDLGLQAVVGDGRL